MNRRANSQWYDIIAYLVLKFKFWLKYFFIYFIFILSHSRATCSRKKCVYIIHQFFIIEIYINKITFLYFFFFFIWNDVCQREEGSSRVLWNWSFFYILWSIRWLTLCWQRKFYDGFKSALKMRYKCVILSFHILLFLSLIFLF